MSLLSVAYLLIAIISVGVTIFDIIQVRIHAQPKVWRILLYLAVAAFSLVLTLQQSQHFDDLVSGVFIVVMFICFACWQKGLADAAMIGGLVAFDCIRIFLALFYRQMLGGRCYWRKPVK